MNSSDTDKRIIHDVLKRYIPAAAVCLLGAATDFIIFRLYGVFTEPVIYSSVMMAAVIAVFVITGVVREKKNAERRRSAIRERDFSDESLPEIASSAEEDYINVIRILDEKLTSVTAEYAAREQDSIDYYTNWVHQIKMPIAVMKLKLSSDSPENRALSSELFRIEQYVDMVLQYIRLGSDSSDLVIKEYSLDELVKETIHKYAPQFIEKRLKLTYSPIGRTVITDKKWFVCILEQFISNAIKYTPSGGITISLEGDRLVISDTGIGIAPEDLPRIFEKGFTGCNGRLGQKSSGLGLYLAKKAANLLSLKIYAESNEGKGSSFSIDVSQDRTGSL